MKPRAIVVYVEYDDGTAKIAKGEIAGEVWDWIESAEVMQAIHGTQYTGTPLEQIAPLNLTERAA